MKNENAGVKISIDTGTETANLESPFALILAEDQIGLFGKSGAGVEISKITGMIAASLFYLAKECAPEELEFSQETIVLAFLSDIREKTVFKLGQKIVEKQTIQN